VSTRVEPNAHITVRDLTMAFGDFILMRDIDFTVKRNDVFVIMGGSGSGKSTLLRHMLGLIEPAKGEILYGDESFTNADDEARQRMLRRCGVLYQSGALFGGLTLEENVALPLSEYTTLRDAEIAELARLKLALVGLKGFEEFYPAAVSGGMQKRAALARAMALDPDVLFFDEPSAGLDPISSRRLDDLIVELRDSLGATIVVVTHELASIFAIGTNSVFLDGESKTMIGYGPPKELLEHGDPRVRRFLTRDADAEHAEAAREGTE
jgi:phospholipid/cholesterol/gamma-HCH transport system ATP-binding protein